MTAHLCGWLLLSRPLCHVMCYYDCSPNSNNEQLSKTVCQKYYSCFMNWHKNIKYNYSSFRDITLSWRNSMIVWLKEQPTFSVIYYLLLQFGEKFLTSSRKICQTLSLYIKINVFDNKYENASIYFSTFLCPEKFFNFFSTPTSSYNFLIFCSNFWMALETNMLFL